MSPLHGRHSSRSTLPLFDCCVHFSATALFSMPTWSRHWTTLRSESQEREECDDGELFHLHY